MIFYVRRHMLSRHSAHSRGHSKPCGLFHGGGRLITAKPYGPPMAALRLPEQRQYKLWLNNGCFVPQELSQPCPPFALPLICVSSVLMEDTRPIKKNGHVCKHTARLFYCSRCLAKVSVKQSLEGLAVTGLVAGHLMNCVVDSVKA